MQTIRHSENSFSTPESDCRQSVVALSNLCDKILESEGLITSKVIATFELEPLMQKDCCRFLPKRELMLVLEEYSNLINAMGALFFVSKQLTQVATKVF